jgi:hypothetical protein
MHSYFDAKHALMGDDHPGQDPGPTFVVVKQRLLRENGDKMGDDGAIDAPEGALSADSVPDELRGLAQCLERASEGHRERLLAIADALEATPEPGPDE